MSERRVHIVGAGMAGLSSALQLSLAGEKVTLYEAAPFAGGRCRSFIDRELDCRIDNGNHLVLSGNIAIQDYLYLTNALATMGGPGEPIFPFMDLESGERWIARMNMGRMPWWIFNKNNRVPGTKPRDYLSALKILTSGNLDIISERLKNDTMLYRRFWEPIVIGVLNTEAETASAKLLANVFAQSFTAGGRQCVPLVPKIGLSETFVAPCLNVLQQKGVQFATNSRLRAIRTAGHHIRELDFNGTIVDVGPKDWVILALPAWVIKDLLPDISVPTEFRSIINAHYRVEVPNNPAGFTGLVGGVAEWAFVKPGVVSVTVSCAERYGDYAVRDLVQPIWANLAKLYDLDPAKVPPHKIFKEKYATFAATPEQNARRPLPFDFRWQNMALAGEWTATGLPSTIEGAIRSGMKAAQIVMRWAD
ncbi:MAG TPA: hydroxysqualene dehydroxylase HpnE [Alphaproteobacteria bacterium]|nr:hydroxysqualene dehydroxylase HpnE [Alphaproteobacteria bacterium]